MSEPRSVQGRCGTCNSLTDTLPCPYCAAAEREHREHVLADDCWCEPEVIALPGRKRNR